MAPDQRRQGRVVAWRHGLLPARARQDLLDHEGVDVDHAVLNQVQREHADLVVLAAIAGHLTAPGEEHEVCGAVPLLDDVQPLVDLAAQRFRTQVSAQKYGFGRLAELGERLVGGVIARFVRRITLRPRNTSIPTSTHRLCDSVSRCPAYSELFGGLAG